MDKIILALYIYRAVNDNFRGCPGADSAPNQ